MSVDNARARSFKAKNGRLQTRTDREKRSDGQPEAKNIREKRKMCPKEKWNEIRAEYISSDISLRQLAKKHGMNADTVMTRSKREKWNAERFRYEHVLTAKVEEKIEAKAEAEATLIVGTREWVKQSLVEVANRCMQKSPVMTFDRENKEYVQATDADGNHLWTFNAAGANRALELVGKDVGMFDDRVSLEVRKLSDADLVREVAGIVGGVSQAEPQGSE